MARIRARRRKRRGYVRRSRAAVKTGWSLRELAALSGVSARTVRNYVQRGLVPPSPFKGPATRYQRRQLLFLLAVRRFTATEKLTLEEIRSRLQAFSAEALERYATEQLSAGPAALALGVMPKGPEVPPAATPKLADHGPRWVRVELALGLELHVRDDASEPVHALARQLHDIASKS